MLAQRPATSVPRAGASVTVPPKKPPAPGTIRRRVFPPQRVKRTPWPGSRAPARDPAEACPSPTRARAAPNRVRVSARYRQNVSHPSHSLLEAAALPAMRFSLRWRRLQTLLRAWDSRALCARVRAPRSADPVRSFARTRPAGRLRSKRPSATSSARRFCVFWGRGAERSTDRVHFFLSFLHWMTWSGVAKGMDSFLAGRQGE